MRGAWPGAVARGARGCRYRENDADWLSGSSESGNRSNDDIKGFRISASAVLMPGSTPVELQKEMLESTMFPCVMPLACRSKTVLARFEASRNFASSLGS